MSKDKGKIGQSGLDLAYLTLLHNPTLHIKMRLKVNLKIKLKIEVGL